METMDGVQIKIATVTGQIGHRTAQLSAWIGNEIA
jgi:hypothetical protein